MTIIKKFDELSLEELYSILRLRNEVFIIEQTCLYQDLDNNDHNNYHCFIIDKEKIIAYGRILAPGVSYPNSPSLGRILVKKDYRQKGYARKLLKDMINFTFQKYNEKTITISAQTYLKSFYSSLGFMISGNEYLEDNIPHIKMILKKPVSI